MPSPPSSPFDSSYSLTISDYDNHISNDSNPYTEIMTMKQRRNGLLPICRLPVEILVRVLHHHQWTPPGRVDNEQPRLSRLFNFTWARVMLVCRHLHSVALSAPELWNTIRREESWEGDGEKARMSLQVARAGALPLVLLGSGVHLQQLLGKACMAELKSLNGCNQSAPLLRELFLQTGYTTVDGSFLGGHSARLARLNLLYTSLEGLPSLPALAHLTLDSVTLPDRELSILVTSLRQAPNLEVLIVKTTYANGHRTIFLPDEVIELRERVELPKLRVLAVEDDPPLVSAVLRAVSSPKATLHVKILYDWQAGVQFPRQQPIQNYNAIFGRCFDMWYASSLANIPPACTLVVSMVRDASRSARWAGKFNYRMYLGTAFTVDEEGEIFEGVQCNSLTSTTEFGPFLSCSTENIPSYPDPCPELVLKSLPASLNRVVLEKLVDAEHLSSIIMVLKERTLRAASFPSDLSQSPLTIFMVECSDLVKERVKAWLDSGDPWVKDVELEFSGIAEE